MKMERLIGILFNLLQREQVTASETGVICMAIHTFEWAFVRPALFYQKVKLSCKTLIVYKYLTSYFFRRRFSSLEM